MEEFYCHINYSSINLGENAKIRVRGYLQVSLIKAEQYSQKGCQKEC